MVRPTSPSRRWNTANPRTPTAIGDVATGLQVRVATYSGRHGEVVTHTGPAGVALGRHDLDGRSIEVAFEAHGSRFTLELAKADPTTVVGRLRLDHAAELRLRLWTLVIVEVDPAAGRIHDTRLATAPVRPVLPGADDVVVRAQARSEHLAVVLDPDPSVCGGYTHADEVVRELEVDGYIPPERDQPERPGAVVARFNHESTAEVCFAVATALDPDTAHDLATAALAGLDATTDAAMDATDVTTGAATDTAFGADRDRAGPRPSDASDEVASQASSAVRDVLGWNTVYDPDNVRVYTPPSRRWAGHRFGGWLVWQSDVLYNALLAASLGDAELALANLDAVLNAAQPAGNLPCLVSGRTEWGDRAHPPLAGFVVWSCAQRLGDTSLATRYLDTLLAAHRWWDRARRFGDHLLAYGSSPTGRGLYARTALAARNESSMDNSPMFDGVPFDADRGVLELAEVGLNALHVLDAEVLAALARDVGRDAEADALVAAGARRAAAIRTRLWDADRAAFAGRRPDGTFTSSLTPTSFFPLLAGIADDDQVAATIERQLTDDDGFWGAEVVPAHRLDDPAVTDDRYWRGRSWPPLHLLTYLAMHRVGRPDLAATLAARGWARFAGPWQQRLALEHYHVRTDGPHLGPDVDTFYSWSALLAYTATCEVGDVTPWDGVRLGPASGQVVLGGRRWRVHAPDGDPPGLDVRPPHGGTVELRGVGSITRVRVTDRGVGAGEAAPRSLSCTLPAGDAPVTLRWHGAPDGVLAALVDGRSVAAAVDDDVVRLELPPAEVPRDVEVVLR